MAKRMARLRYSKKDDKYIIELYDSGTNRWEFESSYKCVSDAEHPESGTDYVSYMALIKIMELIDLGYEVHMTYIEEGE